LIWFKTIVTHADIVHFVTRLTTRTWIAGGCTRECIAVAQLSAGAEHPIIGTVAVAVAIGQTCVASVSRFIANLCSIQVAGIAARLTNATGQACFVTIAEKTVIAFGIARANNHTLVGCLFAPFVILARWCSIKACVVVRARFVAVAKRSVVAVSVCEAVYALTVSRIAELLRTINKGVRAISHSIHLDACIGGAWVVVVARTRIAR